MNWRLRQHEHAQAAVLARMDAARAEFLSVVGALRGLASARTLGKYRVTGIARTLLQTSNTALIAALVAGSVVIGSRRLFGVAIGAAGTRKLGKADRIRHPEEIGWLDTCGRRAYYVLLEAQQEK